MKKIPTLFERKFENHKVVSITNSVTPGFEWVLNGEGQATVKYDGSCCALINGKLYKRYDAKKGKKPPAGGIPCCEPDPVTGHWPHWVLVDEKNPADKWFVEARNNYFTKFRQAQMILHDFLIPRFIDSNAVFHVPDGTYEAIGLHFNGNPYGMEYDTLIQHGCDMTDMYRSFDGIRDFLDKTAIEGIVFWKDGEPKCKIKRTDFGLEWPIRE